MPVIVRNLAHIYTDGRLALDRVSFEVADGERVALVGPNGAGKTTLFLRLCGVLAGKRGQAAVGGLDPADPVQRKRLPATVGIVFQNPDDQLFSSSVIEDVAFGPLNLGFSPEEARQRAEDALRQVGLAGAGDRVPHALSGGEKRRVAIAGILAMQPSVLLLDEPSMYLDPRGRRELIGLINDLPGSMLIATHDLELVLDTCSRAVILNAGQVVAVGSARDLLADPDTMNRHGLEVPYRLRQE